MAHRTWPWGATLLFAGLLAVAVVLATLVDEATRGTVRWVAISVAVLALPMGVTLVERDAADGAGAWWNNQARPLRWITLAGAIIVPSVVLADIATTSGLARAALVLLVMVAFLLATAATVRGIAHVLSRHGAAWSRRALAWAVTLASGSMLVALVVGGLTTPIRAAGLDTLLAATGLAVPVAIVVAATGDAALRAWRRTLRATPV